MQSEENSFGPLGVTIWAVCLCYFVYEFLLRTVVGTFEHPITYDLNLNVIQFAVLSSTAYNIIFGLFQVPVGILIDKIGLKKAMMIGTLLCAIACVGFASTHHYSHAIIFRLMMGLGSAFGFISLVVAIHDWLPQKYNGFLIGISQFVGTMGPMIAAGPLSHAAETGATTWRPFFYTFSTIALVICLLVFIFVRNNDSTDGTSVYVLKQRTPLFKTLRELLSRKQTWCIAIFSGFSYCALEYLSENSGKAFLMLNGFGESQSGYFLSVGWIGYGVGAAALGYISDWLQNRKKVMIAASGIGLLSLIMIVYFPISSTVVTLSFIGLGIGCSGQSIGFAIMSESCPPEQLAAGIGLNNSFLSFSVALNAPIIGYILSVISTDNVISLAEYHQGFMVLIGVLAVGFLFALFGVKETYCKSIFMPTKLKTPYS